MMSEDVKDIHLQPTINSIIEYKQTINRRDNNGNSRGC